VETGDAGGDTAGQQDALDQRYRQLVDHSPDAICVHEAGRLVYVNPAAVRWMAAQSSDQLVGRPITDFVHPDSLGPMISRIATLRELGDTSEPSEAVFFRFDGTTLVVEAISVLTVWEGRPAYQVVFRDLSAQKRAEASLRFQAALIHHVSDAIIATTHAGIVTSWNPAAEAIYQRTAAEALAVPVSEAVGAPLDPAEIVDRGGIVHSTHRAADGSRLVMRVSVASMDSGFVLVCSDQTALRRAELHFETVVNSLEEGVVVLGNTGRVRTANPAAMRIMGIPPTHALGDDMTQAMASRLLDPGGQPLPADQRPVIETLLTKSVVRGRVVGFDRPDGLRVWLSANSSLLNPNDPDNSDVLLSFTDITAERHIAERLAHQATHDGLTGLPNRVRAVEELTAARDAQQPLAAVFFIDLDNLKPINDTLGHPAGDELLRVTGQRLRDCVPAGDFVARLGGDEFLLLLHGAQGTAELDRLAARIHASLDDPVVISGRTVNIRASMGIVEIGPDERRDADQILADADLAMYEAKRSGRGRTHYFRPHLRDAGQPDGSLA
jgi:diguanylate cyclase (GGDEF)-like protein/PAS domain S-box-containing protein